MWLEPLVPEPLVLKPLLAEPLVPSDEPSSRRVELELGFGVDLAGAAVVTGAAGAGWAAGAAGATVTGAVLDAVLDG